MTDETKAKLKYWGLGVITGGGIAAPIAAFIVKRIYDKKLGSATAESYNKGLNDMAEYAVEQQTYSEEDYAESEEDDIPTEEEINNYDLDIDDVDATRQAEISVEDQERYRDMIEKYNGDLELIPRMIDADRFLEDQSMAKEYVNWYEGDNVFEADLVVVRDPYTSFGCADGAELFKNADSRDDADIVYIRNEKQETDYEISRVHGSYKEIVGGVPNIGEADTEQ